MPRKIPSLTLPLCGFAGFSPDTQALLEDLFATAPDADGEVFRGLLLKSKEAINCTTPHEVLLLLQSDTGLLRAKHVFDAPASLRGAVAAPGFLLANDPGCKDLLASMGSNSFSSRHQNFAVTDLGCLSWGRDMPGCQRGKEGAYQAQLDAGGAILAYVQADTPRSAHQKMTDKTRLIPLAEDLYTAHNETPSRASRTGCHRRVAFSSSTSVRPTPPPRRY